MPASTANHWAVIFDMDGVLVDSAAPHFESWRRLGEEHGVVVPRERFAETFGRRNNEIIPLLFGVVSTRQLAYMSGRKEQIYRELIRDRVPIVEGAVELIQSLADAGVPTAIGSSGPRDNIDLVLAAMGVANRMSAIVSADDVTRGKPDPQVFQIAIERLGVPAARCVVVEDAPAGVQAAKSAGARAVAVLMHHRRESFDRADLVVRRLADLSAASLLALVR